MKTLFAGSDERMLMKLVVDGETDRRARLPHRRRPRGRR